MIFKVAILQARAEISNIKRNIDTIICSVKEAAKNGADILLLPECFVTGY
ncbi:nitrilase-related carbon-nitrogen hydrolase, partial [Streptococcus suis]